MVVNGQELPIFARQVSQDKPDILSATKCQIDTDSFFCPQSRTPPSPAPSRLTWKRDTHLGCENCSGVRRRMVVQSTAPPQRNCSSTTPRPGGSRPGSGPGHEPVVPPLPTRTLNCTYLC